MPDEARIEELAQRAYGSGMPGLRHLEDVIRTAMQEAREEQIKVDAALDVWCECVEPVRDTAPIQQRVLETYRNAILAQLPPTTTPNK